MSSIEPQTFSIDTSRTKFIRLLWWGAVPVILLLLIAPFFARNADGSVHFRTSLLGLSFFGLLALYGYVSRKSNPLRAVTVDDDGLWPTHLGKDRGLVSWSAIAALRERPLSQRLDLLDEHSQVLIGLDYQFERFDKLRELVMEKSAVRRMRPALPATFSKSAIYHAGYISSLCLVAWVAWVGFGVSPLVRTAIVLLMAIGLKEYLAEVYKVTVNHDLVIIRYPLTVRKVRCDDIEAVGIQDIIGKTGFRIPSVRLFVRGARQPIRFKGLSGDLSLYQLLLVVKENPRRNSATG